MVFYERQDIEKLRAQLLFEEADLREIIDHYHDSGDVNDLIFLLPEDAIRPRILYMLTEIGSKVARVWKKVLPYVGSKNFSEAHDVVNLVHSYASVADFDELLYCLSNINYDDDRLVNAMLDMMRSKLQRYESLAEVLLIKCLHANLPAVHGVGLMLLSSLTKPLTVPDLRNLLEQNSKELKLYIFLYIILHYSDDDLALSLLSHDIRKYIFRNYGDMA